MNDALRNHLEFREKYGIPAKTRTRFAWRVRIYAMNDRFIAPIRTKWLCRVTEVSGSGKEWIAFEEFQEKSK